MRYIIDDNYLIEVTGELVSVKAVNRDYTKKQFTVTDTPVVVTLGMNQSVLDPTVEADAVALVEDYAKRVDEAHRDRDQTTRKALEARFVLDNYEAIRRSEFSADEVLKHIQAIPYWYAGRNTISEILAAMREGE